ncbi:alpha-1-acid glycoprotein isoform X2 [Fukomys damarensis]|uniref:Alpha-1-acid glycoprotein 8 n=1 Tax=Fukomys damarensis TaxID=885580 RepID=A0A091D3V5_FUKDA|nr:alpha-1-acid glycoprotein isoform X2 [Fukomys damarensis]KFO26769.1 Alpha-1-acid glycoprotein 8 [Fukomys damarensis]
MVLHWALEALCVLPLLNSQNPACTNVTAMPITSATLDWLTRRWFFIASAFRKPEYKQGAQEMQAEFIYFDTRPREDKLWVREHMTIGGRCTQNSTILSVHRENGTFSKTEGNRENFGHLLLLRDPRSFMLAFFLEDEHNRGPSFYADAPEASSEPLEEFREAIRCVGLRTSEILCVDWKKNKCPL